MAAESTVSISDFTRLSVSPLNNIKPTFTESLAYLPDGGKLLLWPICKLEYLIREGEKLTILVTKNGKNHVIINR